MTDAGMQETDSDRAGICEGAIENALVTARGVPTGERTKQIEKMSNQHPGFGSLPESSCLPPISVKIQVGRVTAKQPFSYNNLYTMGMFFSPKDTFAWD